MIYDAPSMNVPAKIDNEAVIAFLWAVGILLSICWLFFPFIVMHKLNRLIKLGRAQIDLLDKIASKLK